MESIDFSPYREIVVLTGAGVSVASGLRPFRGPGGLWEEADWLKYSSRETLIADPLSVWQFFGPMRAILANAQPNPAHLALARLEASLKPGQRFTLITQNIDGLHQRAGSQAVVEMHGTLHRTRCTRPSCKLEPYLDAEPHDQELPRCPHCGSPLRPDIVLFKEMLPARAVQQIDRVIYSCDLFLAAGTSGTVYPAAGFVQAAREAGARTILVNLGPMAPPDPSFREEYLGRAEEVLPQLIGL